MAKKKSTKSFSKAEQHLIKELKALKNALKKEEKRKLIQKLLTGISAGSISKRSLKALSKRLKETDILERKLKVIEEFLSNCPFEERKGKSRTESQIEVILSQYFGGC